MNTHPLPIQVAPVSPRLVAVLFLAATFCATAQTTNELQATVTPGFIWSSSTRLTAQNLNRAANPTVEITGTVPGSALGTNTIGKQHLQTNVYDNLYLSGGNNSAATIIAGSLDHSRMSTIAVGGTNVIDASIEGGDIATNTITAANLRTNWPINLGVITPATNDYILIADASANTNQAAVLVDSLWTNAFRPIYTSSEISFTNSTTVTFTNAHGLGRVPYLVRWVAVCKTNEYTWTAGQELDVNNATYNTTGGQTANWADSSNLYFGLLGAISVNDGDGTVRNLQGSGGTGTWKLKAYAW